MVIGRYGGGLNDIELLLFVFLESSSRIPEVGSVEVCCNEVNARAWPYLSTLILKCEAYDKRGHTVYPPPEPALPP
jgi:hypothetical protein